MANLGVIQPSSWTMPARALTKFLVVYLQNSSVYTRFRSLTLLAERHSVNFSNKFIVQKSNNAILPHGMLISDAGEPITLDFGDATVVDSKKRKGFKGGKLKFRRVLGRLVSEKTCHFWIDCEAESGRDRRGRYLGRPLNTLQYADSVTAAPTVVLPPATRHILKTSTSITRMGFE